MTERGGYTPQIQLHESRAAATVRALTQKHDLFFRAHQLYSDQQPLPVHAAHLRVDPDELQDDPDNPLDIVLPLRGISDGLSMRLLHSDLEWHLQHLPEESYEALLFELLEQLRCESLVSDSYPGIRTNLRRNFSNWLLTFYHTGLTESSFGLLTFTVAQIVWSHLNHYPVLEETEDLMESTRAELMPLIGHHLGALLDCQNDQRTYATHALAIASALNGLLDVERRFNRSRSTKGLVRLTMRVLQLLNNDEGIEKPEFTSVSTGTSRVFESQGYHYRVFTTDYDQTREASELVRDDLLRSLRADLDDHVSRSGLNLQRLVRSLHKVFAQPHRDGWHTGLEEGHLDSARLARLVISPAERQIFKAEARPPRCHASLTFLLDCSGSMKQYALPVALLLDVFSRGCERAGIQSEILGFTTRSWNGGRALKDWRRQQQRIGADTTPPGRLNESLHMVFRDADKSWSRSRTNLGALLKADIYKEGIDGEAVEWACQRLLQHESDRRVLIVISDGCPMDSATQHANDAWYLDNHLRHVVGRYSRPDKIEIVGLGVGLDLGLYYKNHLAIDLATGVDNRLLQDIVQLLSSRQGISG